MVKLYKLGLSDIATPEMVDQVEALQAEGYEPLQDEEVLGMLRKYYKCFPQITADPIKDWLNNKPGRAPVARVAIYFRIREVHKFVERVSPLVFGFSGPDFADKFEWWPDEDEPMPEAQ